MGVLDGYSSVLGLLFWQSPRLSWTDIVPISDLIFRTASWLPWTVIILIYIFNFNFFFKSRLLLSSITVFVKLNSCKFWFNFVFLPRTMSLSSRLQRLLFRSQMSNIANLQRWSWSRRKQSFRKLDFKFFWCQSLFSILHSLLNILAHSQILFF